MVTKFFRFPSLRQLELQAQFQSINIMASLKKLAKILLSYHRTVGMSLIS